MYRPGRNGYEWFSGPPERAKFIDCGLLDDCRTLVHPLVLCPPIAQGTRYLLVERKWWGEREVLAVEHAQAPHESVNLAYARYAAATLGANEVHVLGQ